MGGQTFGMAGTLIITHPNLIWLLVLHNIWFWGFHTIAWTRNIVSAVYNWGNVFYILCLLISHHNCCLWKAYLDETEHERVRAFYSLIISEAIHCSLADCPLISPSLAPCGFYFGFHKISQPQVRIPPKSSILPCSNSFLGLGNISYAFRSTPPVILAVWKCACLLLHRKGIYNKLWVMPHFNLLDIDRIQFF